MALLRFFAGIFLLTHRKSTLIIACACQFQVLPLCVKRPLTTLCSVGGKYSYLSVSSSLFFSQALALNVKVILSVLCILIVFHLP